jgi:chorismate dehydratase
MTELTSTPFRIATVPYLNALPLYVGLQALLENSHFQFLSPSQVAEALRTGKADLGLVPTFSLLQGEVEDLVALPDIGICSHGEVMSVYVGSQVPLHEVEEIYLDPESQSSNALLKILAPVFFSLKIRLLPSFLGYEKEIQGKRAGLLIGDRAFRYREVFPYRLDLGQAWQKYTHLPFVFALWAIRREKISQFLVETLRLAWHLGKRKIPSIAQNWSQAYGLTPALCEQYLREHIHYELGAAEHDGLKRFMHLAIALNLIEPQREIIFYETSGYYRSGISGQKNLGC